MPFSTIASLFLHAVILFFFAVDFSDPPEPLKLEAVTGIDIEMISPEDTTSDTQRKKTANTKKELKPRPLRAKGAPKIDTQRKTVEAPKPKPIPAPKPEAAPKPSQQKPAPAKKPTPKPKAQPAPPKKAAPKTSAPKKSPPKQAPKTAPRKTPAQATKKAAKPKGDVLTDIIKNLAPDEGGKAEGRSLKNSRAPKRGNTTTKLNNGQISLIQQELKKQIEENWSHSSYKKYDFHLNIKLGANGKVENVTILNETKLSADVRPAAETAQRAILRMGAFKVPAKIFPPKLHKEWGEIRIRFSSSH